MKLLIACSTAWLAACQSTAPVASEPPGSYLAVLNKADATISIIEPNSGFTRDQSPTGTGPHEAAAARDGSQIVVCNYGDQTPGSTLSIYDLGDRRVVSTIDLSPHKRPHGIAYLDNRSTVLVTSETSRAVLEVDLGSGKVKRVLDTGANVSHMLALTPDRSRVFTANMQSDSVSAIDLKSGSLIQVVPTGDEPEAIDISPDGSEVWVGHRKQNTLVVLDAATLEKKAEIPCAETPIRLKFTPDGREVWVTCVATGDVAVFDAKARKEIARIALEPLAAAEPNLPPGNAGTNPLPVGILFDPRGRHAFVANMAAKRVSVIEVATRTIKAQIATGNAPDGMAWSYSIQRAGLMGGAIGRDCD